MPAMSQTTNLLLWVHWIQFGAERIAVAGAGLFAGAQLYRSLLVHPRLLRADDQQALSALRNAEADRWLAGTAGIAALASALACLGGGMAWVVPGIAVGLAALYLMTEVRRTCEQSRALRPDEVEGSAVRALLERWKRQHAWLAATAAAALLALVLIA
jgi:hypothetical protein